MAQNLKWPTDQWSLLLQSILKGKAQEAYTASLISECVKNAILKACELPVLLGASGVGLESSF